MEQQIMNYLRNQMLFADTFSPFEQALTYIFGKDGNFKEYEGQEQDKQKILDESASMEDITRVLNKYEGEWNFEKNTPFRKIFAH